MSELVEAVLDSVRQERVFELGLGCGKPWDDDAVWPIYLRAVEARRRAVDAWLESQPTTEAEAVEMAL